MNTSLAIEPEVVSDAALVELSLDGDRDAFGQLVARYQSAICAMGFSACGNVERSEDIAQEVFVTAWRQLSKLNEAAKFKQWLYGIARNLIHNSFRQEIRNPIGDAEQFEEDGMADFDLPDSQAISKEEQAILWHVLSGLPQIYREPMVLFYRQNDSVPAVADTLGISEEAVRQRLSRGRLLLAERVTRVIRSGLRRSGPGPTFAVAVVGALPIIAAATTAQGAVVKAGAAKGVSNAGWLASLKALGFMAAILAIPTAPGRFNWSTASARCRRLGRQTARQSKILALLDSHDPASDLCAVLHRHFRRRLRPERQSYGFSQHHDLLARSFVRRCRVGRRVLAVEAPWNFG